MIGKVVTGKDFQELLDRQGERDEFVEEVMKELKAIKPGECLLYEARPDAPLWVSIGIALLVDKVKGLKVIKEGNATYVYRSE